MAGVSANVIRLLGVATPLYLSMAAASASAMVSSAALGRFHTLALAAFAAASAVYTPAVSAVTGAVRGSMPFIAEAREDAQRLRAVLTHALSLALAVGVLGAGAVLCFPVLAAAIGIPREVLASLGALPALLAGALAVAAVNAVAVSALVSLRRPRPVLYSGLAAAATSAALALLLVPGAGPLPPLGAAGAGAAVLGSQVISAAIAGGGLRAELARRPGASPGARRRPEMREVARQARVGVPMAGTVLVKFGVLGLVTLAASRISAAAGAAHSIATTLVGITFAVAVAVGQALIPLLSTPDATATTQRAGMRAALGITTVALVLFAAVLICAGRPIAGMFSRDPSVLAILTRIMPIVAVSIVLDGAQAVFGFGLTALKRSSVSFTIFSLVYGALALVSLPASMASGMSGLWVAIAGANALAAMGQCLAFSRAAVQVKK